MLLKLKAIFGKSIILLFLIFIIYNIIYFIVKKPISMFFPEKFKFIWWLSYVGLIIIISTALYFTLKKLAMKSEFINSKLAICVILFTTIATRILWIYNISVIPKDDFNTYHIFASSMSKGVITGHNYIALFPHYIGYPSLLALFYKVFGNSELIAPILNVILSCGITLLLYKIGSRIKGTPCGFISAILWALWPSQIFYTSLICTEYLYTFLVLFCMNFFIAFIGKKRSLLMSVILFLIFGTICAITNAIRPLALIVLIASIIYYIFFFHEELTVRSNRNLAKAILSVFMILGYTLTSYFISASIEQLIGREIPKKPVGYNLYVGLNYFSSGSWNLEDSNTLSEISKETGIKPQQIHDKLFVLAIERAKSYSIKGITELMINKHRTMWITDHDSIMYIFSGFNKDLSKLDFYKYERLLIKLSNFYYYLILIISAIGITKLIIKKEQDTIIYFVLFILGMIFAHMLVEVAGRYHFPAISFLSLVAGYSAATSYKTDLTSTKQKLPQSL
ncbi:MAG: hypothetical protein GX660_13890 [Clostridiaceae bacterium]|nr:hypothetical protein [Clostridiaceae bacterium]